MLTIKKIANVIEKTLSKVKSPAEVLPAFLLYCTAMKRSGLCGEKTAAEIISQLAGAGFETGKNPDGTDNKINQFVYCVVKGIFDALKTDAVIHTGLPKGGLMVKVSGANAGGPIEAIGTNIIDTLTAGLIR